MKHETGPGMEKENLPGPTMNEENLQRLWKDILDLPRVSHDDDFFLCGGNSLTAIELLIRIQREFHINLPPDTIYRYPTLYQQTMLLRKNAATAKEYHPLIFPLREGGDLPPLFCIHTLGGVVDHYLNILPAIDKSRPVFGIRGRGLVPGETLPKTLGEIAREEVDAVRTVQKTGPYHILGFSFGGIVAFELACQLQELGEDVAFLGIIDVCAPAHEDRYLKTLANKVIPNGRLRKIAEGADRYLKSHSDRRVCRVVSRSLWYAVHRVICRSGAKSISSGNMDTHFEARFNIKSLDRYPKEQHPAVISRMKASSDYLPTRFRGGIIFFSTGPDHGLFPGDMTRGWGFYVSGKCDIIEVPGDHSTLFNEPHVGILAEKINQSLGAVR
jgi:thioesterase domain-containing protein/acyl carrier protein